MKVICAGGSHVGYVKQIENNHLVIGRPSASDLYVPLADCQIRADDVAVLQVPVNQIDGMGWARPDRSGWR